MAGLVAMLVLMALSAFLSGSETALFFLSHDEIRAFRVGRPRERAAAALLADPDRALTGILFWNLVVNLLYFAVAIVVSERLLAADLRSAAAVLGFAALIALLLFGEVVPKVAAALFRRGIAPLVALPIIALVRLLDPALPFFRGLTQIARRAFLPHIHQEPYLSPQDLENAVNVSDLSAEMIRQEKQILHNILDLSDITAEEVMRPRGTYPTCRAPVRILDLAARMPAGDYVAVVREGTEDVESAIALGSISRISADHLAEGAEDVVHVPWCAKLGSVLTLMREQVASVASVVNEYGETIGMLTYDDILNTVLIPEPDRAARLLSRPPVLEVAPGCYHAEGITSLRHLSGRLGIEYDADADGLVTLAGLLQEKLEHLPAVGDECQWHGFRIRVIEVSKRGRLRAMLTRDQHAEEASA
ncbi:MAG TPA: CNNM domain-containing protein [Planctomycetaceae bacterium]|nr:CNNM domain-containing protein [Planctomycetaceae bacterium]